MGRMSHKKKRHKSNESLDHLLEAPERECKIRQDELEVEARGRYHGYSAGTAHSAARSTAVTNAATATEVTTVYADGADNA